MVRPNSCPGSERGTLFTLDTFRDKVITGDLTDYNGCGFYAIGMSVSEEEILPSDVLSDRINRSYTHVVWFHRKHKR